MKSSVIYLLTSLIFVGVMACNNLEDAKPPDKAAFIKLIEGPLSIEASSLEITNEGYIVMGNMNITDDSIVTVIARTDLSGNQIGNLLYYGGGSGNKINQLGSNNSFQGYVVIGDSININPAAEEAANIEITSARILILDEDFNVVRNVYLTDQSDELIKADFSGNTLTVTPNGDVIFLGTFKEGAPNQLILPEKPYLFALDNALSLKWFEQYESEDRNYRNSKSIHFRNGEVVWAAALADVQVDFTNSFVSIPRLPEESIFVNYDTYGANSTQLILPNDIQPAFNPGLGYGIIGTFSKATDGSQGNVFFLRTRSDGTIIEGSGRFFDAKLSENNVSIDSLQTSVIDTGETLTSTKDGGYVLAGTFITLPGVKGNGARDIFLIKVNSLGDIVWNTTIGGPGDEVVSSIRETPTGDIVFCGTNTLGGFSSMFLIRTDKNGQLKN